MGDMAERLRRVARDESSEWSTWQDLCNDAADEIEWLQRELRCVVAHLHKAGITECDDRPWSGVAYLRRRIKELEEKLGHCLDILSKYNLIPDTPPFGGNGDITND